MLNDFIEKPRKNETAIIRALWTDPSNYRLAKEHKFVKDTFVTDKGYVFYHIGLEMYNYGITEFDKLSVCTFLDTRKDLKKEFEDAGGLTVIEEIKKELNDFEISNIEYHIEEVFKFQALRYLYDKGLLSSNNEKTLKLLENKGIEEVKLFLTHQINNSMSQFNSSNYEVRDLIDDTLFDTIDSLKKGIEGAISFYGAPILNKFTKGWQRGKLYYLEMPSGLGKSTFSRNIFLPSIIENQENSLIFVNEESIDTWRVNLLITIANTKIKDGFVFRDNVTNGYLKPEDETLLKKAAKWLLEHKEDFIIKIIALKTYKFSDVLRIIESYEPYQITTCIIDTFKPDLTGGLNKSRWESFSENAQQLYDLIKKENMNIRCLATVQMKIGGGTTKYSVNLENTGKSKEIVEVADVVMQGRKIYAEEYSGGERELKIYRYKLNNDYDEDFFDDDDFDMNNNNNNKKTKHSKWEKTQVMLDEEKNYIMLSFGKNRDGSVDKQIIYEVDYQKNVVHEIGFSEVKEKAGE